MKAYLKNKKFTRESPVKILNLLKLMHESKNGCLWQDDTECRNVSSEDTNQRVAFLVAIGGIRWRS